MSRPLTQPPPPRPAQDQRPSQRVVTGLVAEFLEEKREEARLEVAVAERRRLRERIQRPALAAALLLVCAAAWFAPLPKPTPAPQAPMSFRLASGRLALNLAARRVDAFVARHGRLPLTLADANVDEYLMIMRPLGPTEFVLQMRVGAVVLTYDSSIAPAVQSDDASTILRTTLR